MYKWVMAILMMMWLTSCGGQEVPGGTANAWTPLLYAESIASTDLSDELEGLGMLDASRQEVKAARGEPLMTGDIVINGKKQRPVVMEYEDYHYSLDGDRVHSFTIPQGGESAKGISIGNDSDQIKEAYGKDYYTRQMAQTEILGYADKENDIVIEFMLNDDKISLIMVSRLSVNQ